MPRPASELSSLQERDRYQAGEVIEARFGGRSKWFPGKVRRTYERDHGHVLFDVDFDDGDKEEGVIAGRLRRHGQTPPPFQAGLRVDVKLARKGKGYHPGTIGRVNGDGTLYVKLDDGDCEWSVTTQQAIPIYPYAPATSVAAFGSSSTGTSSDTTAKPESPMNATASRDPFETGGKRGLDGNQPSATIGNPPPSGDLQDTDSARQESDTGRVTPEASPPFHTTGGQQGNQLSGQSKDDNDGGGLSWITDLVKSTKPQHPPVKTVVGEDPDGGGGGLDWITEVATRAAEGSTDPLGSTSFAGEPNRSSSSSVLPPNSSRNGYVPAGAAGGENTPGAQRILGPHVHPTFSPSPANITAFTTLPLRAESPGVITAASLTTIPVTMAQRCPPLAHTPSHLEWKPITDGSASRTWGAPPPDEVGDSPDMTNKEKSENGGVIMAGRPQQQQAQHKQQQEQERQQSVSPPTMLRKLEATASSSGAVVAAVSTKTKIASPKTSSTLSKHHELAEVPCCNREGGSETAGADASTDAAGLIAPENPTTSAAADARSNAGCKDPSNSAVGGASVCGGETRAHSKDTRQADSVAVGGKQLSREAQELVTGGAPGKVETGGLVSQTKCPDGLQMKLPQLQEIGPKPGQGGSGESSSRWATLRSSVQRRFAAEAVHAAEEVRLLTAKLKVADEKAQAKLVQRERELVGQMEESLQRERDKIHALWNEDRAANARRIRSLKEELDLTKRRLETERSRTSTQVAARERQSPSRGRRRTLTPPLYRNAIGGAAASTKKGSVIHRKNPETIQHTVLNRQKNVSGAFATRSASPLSTPAEAAATASRWGWTRERVGGHRLPPSPKTATKLLDGHSAAFLPIPTPSYDGVGGIGDPTCGDYGSDYDDDVGVVTTVATERRAGADHVQPPPPPLSQHEGRRATGGLATTGANAPLKGDSPAKTRTTAGVNLFGITAELTDDGDVGTQEVAAHQLHDRCRYREENLRWKLQTERRDTRRRLEAMKEEVERVIGQFRMRAERAEAAAASAESKAAVKALRYLRSKRPTSPVTF